MNRIQTPIIVATLCLAASAAQGFVNFDETRYMHPDGGVNAREDGSASLANDGAGNWVAVTDGPFVSRSSDNGDTWTIPVLMPGGDGYYPSLYTDPMISTDKNGTWILARSLSDFGPGNNQVQVWRSTDNGATWSVPIDLAAATGTSFDVRPRIANDGGSNWMIVWDAVEPINDDYDVMVSTSSDDGLTWSLGTWVSGDALSDSDDNWYPSVATDGAGNWVVVDAWLGGLAVNWQVRAYRSTDFGATWTGPVQVSTHLGQAWVDIVSGGPGIFLTLHTKTSAYIGRTTDGGATWDDKNISGQFPSANARPAHLDTDGNGEWIAVWDSDDDPSGATGTDLDILFSKSIDNGVTWSSPKFIDLADAIADTTEDAWPVVSSDGNGRWIAAWQRTSGGALDMFMTISDPLCPDVRRVDCITGESGKSLFSISDKDGTDKDKIKFKLSKGGLTTVADFGDPTATGDMLLCLWDATGDVDALEWRATLPAGVTCGGEPCWKESSTGFGYSDKEKENSGFSKAKLKAGEAGKAQVQVQFGGTVEEVPRAPLDNDSSIAVQLISNETGKCWGAAFSTPTNNEPGKYKAKSD